MAVRPRIGDSIRGAAVTADGTGTMSDQATTVVGDVLRVLVVGDSSALETTMDALSSEFESISVVRERTLSSALERLAQLDVHCAVCPFEGGEPEPSPLEQLRASADELPILVVHDGTAVDPETAATALEAGATDVIEADDPRPLIAARVRNAAECYRLETAATRRSQSILERSNALVWVVDERGTVEYASSAVEPRMGYTPDELERTPVSRLVHPDDRESMTETLETVSSAAFGGTERVAVRFGHADGTWHAYELTATNRLADPVVGGVVLTLSAPSGAESGDGARPALERLSDPLIGLGPQWELRYANGAATRLFEADVDAEAGTVVWDLIDETVRDTFYDRLHEATATDRVVEFETPYPPLETRLLVSVHPGANGVTVHAREAPDDPVGADRERFDLLESIVETLDDGLAVLDGSTIRFANSALLELAGADALVGRSIEDVFDDDLAAAVRERAGSPVVRWMDPLSGFLATDERRAVDVFVAPLSAADRTLCVVRDRRRSSAAALSTVREAIVDIGAADDRSAVRRAVVDATLAATDADLAGWYALEDDVLRPVTVETAASDATVEVPAIDRGTTALTDRLAIEPERVGDGVVFDRSDLETFLGESGIRAERVFAVPIADHGILLATSTEPMAFGAIERRPIDVVAGGAAMALDALEGRSAIRACRADLDRLETVVDRCHRLRDVERTLLAGETREQITGQLCEALVSLPDGDAPGSIGLAWVGDVTTGSERITPSSWAGRVDDSLESISISMTDDARGHPAARAATTLEPTAERIGADVAGDADREWQRWAVERGFRSVLSVPLVVDDFCYAVLTAYGEQPSTADVLAESCTHLAAIAGHAIAAVERKRALLSERVTELELVFRNEDEPLSAVANRLDQRLRVQAVVPRSTAGSTVFCTVPDVDEATVTDALEELPAVESGRIVGNRADAAVLELVLAESTVAETLAEHGGVLRSVTPTDDRTRLLVDLSSSVDVGSFVRMLERTHPGAELVARRERDRSTRTSRAFETELQDRLSERQRRTLETAYYGGFFEWPRESTGEDVAESLGVSQPTFSRHLRVAQRKVFAMLFEERLDASDR